MIAAILQGSRRCAGSAAASPVATSIVVASQPSSTVEDTNFTVTIQVKDQFGNNISSTASISVTKQSGTGTLSGTSPVSAVAGLATFSNLQMDTAGASVVLRFSATGAGLGTCDTSTIAVTSSSITYYLNKDFASASYTPLTDGGGGDPSNYTLTGGVMEANLGSSGSDQAANAYFDNGSRMTGVLWLHAKTTVITKPVAGGVKTQKMYIFREGGFGTQFGELNQIDGDWQYSHLTGGANIDLGVAVSTAGETDILIKYDPVAGTNARPLVSIWIDGVLRLNASQRPTQSGVTDARPTIVNFGGTLNASSGASRWQHRILQLADADPS